MSERIRVGSGVRCGEGVRFGVDKGIFPWSGNTNVAAIWLANSEYVSTTSNDVDSWVTVEAYTTAGASTTYTLSSSGSARPNFNSTGMGGKGVIEHDGTAEYLECTDSEFLALPNGDDTSVTVIGLWNYGSGASGNHFWGWFETLARPMFRLIQAGASYRLDIDADNDGIGVQSAAFKPVDTGTVDLKTLRRSGTSVYLYHNDVADPNNPGTVDVGQIGDTELGFSTFVTACKKEGSGGTPSNFTPLDLRMLAVVLNDDTTAITQIENYFISEQGL